MCFLYYLFYNFQDASPLFRFHFSPLMQMQSARLCRLHRALHCIIHCKKPTDRIACALTSLAHCTAPQLPVQCRLRPSAAPARIHYCCLSAHRIYFFIKTQQHIRLSLSFNYSILRNKSTNNTLTALSEVIWSLL